MKRLLIILTLANLLLSACGGSPTPNVETTVQAAIKSTQSAQPTETSAPKPSDTLMPTNTPAPKPTDTPVPTETSTSTPTDTPVPTETSTSTPTDTPEPTDTPTSEPTDTPTPMPEPTDTPAPTETPVPVLPTTTPTADSGILFRDNFDGTLKAGWSWVREAPTHWNLTDKPGSLRIILQPGGLSNISSSTANNILLYKAPDGNFEIATQVDFRPTSNYQFAGLIIYQDDRNALQLGRAFCDTTGVCIGNGIYFNNIQGGEYSGAVDAIPTASQAKAYLRLRREGTTYTGYYSEDGTNWTVIGQHTSNLSLLRIGLIAAQAYEAETTADFDYFTIEALP